MIKGFVYLISDDFNGVYKIGASRNSTTKRLKQLQTGNSNELILLETIESDYPYRLENILHRRFRSKLAHGEWYYLTEDDVKNFKETCKQINEIIDVMKDNPFFKKNLR